MSNYILKSFGIFIVTRFSCRIMRNVLHMMYVYYACAAGGVS